MQSTGPNNQKRDLRHVLALARELDVGVILPGASLPLHCINSYLLCRLCVNWDVFGVSLCTAGLFKHYRDAPPPPSPPQPPHPPGDVDATQLQQSSDMPEAPPLAPPSPLAPTVAMAYRQLGPGGRPLSPAPKSCFSEPVPHYMPFLEVLDRWASLLYPCSSDAAMAS
jgi:hypothetical protein